VFELTSLSCLIIEKVGFYTDIVSLSGVSGGVTKEMEHVWQRYGDGSCQAPSTDISNDKIAPTAPAFSRP
jgi:hypothetical protein